MDLKRRKAMSKLIIHLREEPRSICAVLDGLRCLTQYSLTGKATIDPRVLRGLLHYLETYAARLHHPKEDLYLFTAMRQFGPRVESVIAGLEREHAGGERALRDLDHCLARCEITNDRRFTAFANAVEDYARDYLLHMKKEEDEIFPLALELLTAEDWKTIDSACRADHDPFIAAQEKRDLKEALDRVVQLAPSPIGVAATR